MAVIVGVLVDVASTSVAVAVNVGAVVAVAVDVGRIGVGVGGCGVGVAGSDVGVAVGIIAVAVGSTGTGVAVGHAGSGGEGANAAYSTDANTARAKAPTRIRTSDLFICPPVAGTQKTPNILTSPFTLVKMRGVSPQTAGFILFLVRSIH